MEVAETSFQQHGGVDGHAARPRIIRDRHPQVATSDSVGGVGNGVGAEGGEGGVWAWGDVVEGAVRLQRGGHKHGCGYV